MKNYVKIQEDIQERLLKQTQKPTLLLHTCCALCFSSAFLQCMDYFNVTVFFFNPNIYPKEEYEKRKLETLRILAIYEKEFHVFIGFVEQIEDFSCYLKKKIHTNQCFDCINNRLLTTYHYANKHHFDYCSTTLTVGRLKDSYLINQMGESLEPFFQTKYFYSDFKKKDGIGLSLKMKEKYAIYAQNYCGCEAYKGKEKID